MILQTVLKGSYQNGKCDFNFLKQHHLDKPKLETKKRRKNNRALSAIIMKKQQKLLALIDATFSQTLHPHIDEIYENKRCKEEYIEYLGQRVWQETLLDNLVYRDDIIVSLSNTGFLYYLPVFLCFMLIHYSEMDVLGGTVIDQLTPILDGMNNPRASWVRNIYDCLTEQQQKCIQKVLLHLWETYDDGLVDDALNNYWFDNP